MKEITLTIPKTGYVCDVCGKSSYSDFEIRRCEEQHKCSHSEVTFWLDNYNNCDFGYNFPNCNIQKKCNICGIFLDKLDLSNLSTDALSDVYSFLKYPSLEKLEKNLVDINKPKDIPEIVMNQFWKMKEEIGSLPMGISEVNGGWFIVSPGHSPTPIMWEWWGENTI